MRTGHAPSWRIHQCGDVANRHGWEAADINKALPETAAMAEKMLDFTSEGPSFSNVEVIDQPSQPT